jgi:tetratricopeptide (TPR) repeat protein
LERSPEDQEVCNINEALSESYNERGFRFYQRVEFNLAMEDYSKSIDFGSKSQCKEKANTLAAAYYNRGTVKYRMSHFSDASNDFINATQLRPNNVEFNKALTETLARIKELS